MSESSSVHVYILNFAKVSFCRGACLIDMRVMFPNSVHLKRFRVDRIALFLNVGTVGYLDRLILKAWSHRRTDMYRKENGLKYAEFGYPVTKFISSAAQSSRDRYVEPER